MYISIMVCNSTLIPQSARHVHRSAGAFSRAVWALVLLAAWGASVLDAFPAGFVYDFDLGVMAQQHPSIAGVKPGAEDGRRTLWFTPKSHNESLEIWQTGKALDWSKAKYLICEVSHTNGNSAIINLDFYRRVGRREGETTQQGQAAAEVSRGPRISPKIGVLPGLRTQLVFPLSHLDGQEIFMARWPRQLKGTVSGSRLDPSEIGAVRLRLSPVQAPDYLSHLLVYRVFLSDSPPEPLPPEAEPYVDEFGQWARKDWPGKIRNANELKERFRALELQANAGKYPSDWSRYGGWKEKQFEATGFFRAHHDGRRWWLVDPEGYVFLSAGMDCVGANISTTVRGQEDLFAWLPPRGDRGGVDFLVSNLSRVYGAEWRAEWERITTGLLKSAGFNTVANWSDLRFARRAGMPYVLPMGGFPRTQTRLYRDFPDVFSEEYSASARRFAAQLQEFKDDPFLIGYFLSNEPHWAFGKNNIAFEMFATPQQSATKTEFLTWVRAHYRDDLEKFNLVWKLSLSRFDDLGQTTFRDPPSDAAEKDFWEFSGLMAQRYVGVPCDAVKAVDPNHLNLGMRYAWVSSDLLYQAGQRFDVFSINGYSFPGSPTTTEVARRSGKPVMIGEFHFGATDRGLPSTGIQGTPTQAERAKAYRYYVEHGFARPEVVGLHYFQWFDQAITGRFDGENYNIGFLDTCHQPYPELMQAARQTHERLYRIAAGEEKPCSEQPLKAPAVFF